MRQPRVLNAIVSGGRPPLLNSMTGQGQAQHSNSALSVSCEIRSVNNRFLKITISCNDRLGELESQIKSLVQSKIRRGSIHVQLDVLRGEQPGRYRVNTGLLKSFVAQLREVEPGIGAAQLVALPGVVEELVPPSLGGATDAAETWSVMQTAVDGALGKLLEMRVKEGASMANDLIANCDQIRDHLAQIQQRSPQVVEDYSRRLTERINQLLSEFEISISPSDVIREVGIFAEKCDISEEIVRLQTHLDQFCEIVNARQSDGRKLEFVTQEMLRETNTIGSKANDAAIAQNVVEIKTAIERIREMTQNIE